MSSLLSRASALLSRAGPAVLNPIRSVVRRRAQPPTGLFAGKSLLAEPLPVTRQRRRPWKTWAAATAVAIGAGAYYVYSHTDETPYAHRDPELLPINRVDHYYWLRDDTRSDPKVLRHLERENRYTEKQMSDTAALRERLYRGT